MVASSGKLGHFFSANVWVRGKLRSRDNSVSSMNVNIGMSVGIAAQNINTNRPCINIDTVIGFITFLTAT